MIRASSLSPAHALAAALVAGACVLAAEARAADEDLTKWRYFETIKLDTSPSGAAVKGDVKNFPVAVTLGPNNFDFAHAKADGSDLRFTKTAKGPLLPHAIEYWDQAGRSAVVWVKLDVVKGKTKAQSFVMHWGNPEAADVADSKAVFDSKEGFVGVYHLNEEGNTTEGGYKDATGNEAHFTGVNLKPGARVDGRVGKGVSFNYAEAQWLKLDHPKKKRLFDLTTHVTVSIWAKARSYQNKGNKEIKSLPGYETMFAKGDNSWRLQKFGIRDWHKPPADLLEMCVEQTPNADLCVVGKTDMAPGQWFHVVAVHDFPKAKIYVNGVLEKADTFDVNWISGDHPVGIGNQSQFPEKGRQWDGILDEARALNVSKNDDWIKLDYESQREGSKLLIYGKLEERKELTAGR
jgi:Concanavalin A-like lectin/glucanases superfamily/Domain of unknown function (DUF2341)